MPVPSTVADLDSVAANNFPTGSEPIGTSLDDYLRSHAAIIKQVSDAAPTLAGTNTFTSGNTFSGGVTVPSTATGNCYSATYTPTLTNTTNVSSSTATQCQYMRVGNMVTVSGLVSATGTASATATVLEMSLPVSSTFASSALLGGTGASSTTSYYGSVGVAILASTSNNRAIFRFIAPSTSSVDYRFTFSYLVV